MSEEKKAYCCVCGTLVTENWSMKYFLQKWVCPNCNKFVDVKAGVEE